MCGTALRLGAFCFVTDMVMGLTVVMVGKKAKRSGPQSIFKAWLPSAWGSAWGSSGGGCMRPHSRLTSNHHHHHLTLPYLTSHISHLTSRISHLCSVQKIMALPPQTSTPLAALFPLPDQEALRKAFVGASLDTLRTPAAIVDVARVRDNCARMHKTAKDWGAMFRAHVKTHKVSRVYRH